MFSIPNSTISLATYDPTQTWEYDAENVSGYLFCSSNPVYVRLTVGDEGQDRILPETFLAPGALVLDAGQIGKPVKKVEVRAANAAASPSPQFWGVLATATDPIRSFVPTNYAITQGGGFIPPIPVVNPLQFQHNTALVDTEPTADFEDTNSIQWTLTPDVANTRVKVFANTNLELDLVNSTASVPITATTLATAQAIITSDPITINNALGTIFLHIECYIPKVKNTTAGQSYDLVLVLFDTFTATGVQIAEIQSGNATDFHTSWFYKTWFTPANGVHTWSIRGFVAANGATCEAMGTTAPMQLHIGQSS